MAPLRPPLPIARLTDRQLWSTLHGRLSHVEQACWGLRGRTAILADVQEAQAIAQELRMRGQQLPLLSGDVPFPRELPRSATVGHRGSRA